MNLAQLQAAVVTETNRPDLVAEILQSVLEATLSCHTSDSYYKDIQEAQVVFDQPTWYLQTLDTSSLPFYRSMAYIRKSNPISTQVEQQNELLPSTYIFPPNQFSFIKRIDIGDAIDGYGYEKRDVWYQSGAQINIKSSTALQYATIGWYKYPNIDVNNFSSWIAVEFPYVIVYKAAGSLYAKIGEDKSAALYTRQPVPGQGEETGGMYYQQLAMLRRLNIIAEG